MTRKTNLTGAVLVAMCGLASVLVRDILPDRVPIHWNLHGEIDGWGDKSWAAWLMPAAMFNMLLVFCILPWLSPHRYKVDHFRGAYERVFTLTLGLMAFLHGVMLWSALHPAADTARVLVAGILFYLGILGPVMKDIGPNFWIGVRVPWTLANDRIWKETHQFAAVIFTTFGIGGGAAVAAGLPLPAAFVLLITGALLPVPYSLVRYKRLERIGEL